MKRRPSLPIFPSPRPSTRSGAPEGRMRGTSAPPSCFARRVASPRLPSCFPEEIAPHPPLLGTFSPLRGAKGKWGEAPLLLFCISDQRVGGQQEGRHPPYFSPPAIFPSPRPSAGRRCPEGADDGDFGSLCLVALQDDGASPRLPSCFPEKEPLIRRLRGTFSPPRGAKRKGGAPVTPFSPSSLLHGEKGVRGP